MQHVTRHRDLAPAQWFLIYTRILELWQVEEIHLHLQFQISIETGCPPQQLIQEFKWACCGNGVSNSPPLLARITLFVLRTTVDIILGEELILGFYTVLSMKSTKQQQLVDLITAPWSALTAALEEHVLFVTELEISKVWDFLFP